MFKRNIAIRYAKQYWVKKYPWWFSKSVVHYTVCIGQVEQNDNYVVNMSDQTVQKEANGADIIQTIEDHHFRESRQVHERFSRIDKIHLDKPTTDYQRNQLLGNSKKRLETQKLELLPALIGRGYLAYNKEISVGDINVQFEHYMEK